MPPGPSLLSSRPRDGFPVHTPSISRMLPHVSPLFFVRFNEADFCVDSTFLFQYSVCMRWVTVLILTTLLYNVFAASQPITSDMIYGEHELVITPDVCHESASEFTDDDELPGVSQQQGTMTPVLYLEGYPSVSPLFMKFLLTAQHERPPKA